VTGSIFFSVTHNTHTITCLIETISKYDIVITYQFMYHSVITAMKHLLASDKYWQETCNMHFVTAELWPQIKGNKQAEGIQEWGADIDIRV
jgi:hypothetical protein